MSDAKFSINLRLAGRYVRTEQLEPGQLFYLESEDTFYRVLNWNEDNIYAKALRLMSEHKEWVPCINVETGIVHPIKTEQNAALVEGRTTKIKDT